MKRQSQFPSLFPYTLNPSLRDSTLADRVWNSLTPCIGGKVGEIVTEGKAEVKSNKGNTISKNASEDNPAVKIERSGVSWRAWDSDSCHHRSPAL